MNKIKEVNKIDLNESESELNELKNELANSLDELDELELREMRLDHKIKELNLEISHIEEKKLEAKEAFSNTNKEIHSIRQRIKELT